MTKSERIAKLLSDPCALEASAACSTFRLLNIGPMPYARALDKMRDLAKSAPFTPYPATLLLTEHEPVITLGRRADWGEMKTDAEILAKLGIEVHQIERGGLATVHGPGQLMIYPVMDLRRLGLGSWELVQRLEQVVIDVLADFQVPSGRRSGLPGIWVGEAKIASIGLAIRRGVSLHGVALNNSVDLSLFDLVTPCGITGVQMTSILQQNHEATDPVLLRSAMVRHFSAQFDLTPAP